MPPKAVSKGPAPREGDEQEKEVIRALIARVEVLGEREGQLENERLWREAELAVCKEAMSAKFDRLIGVFALLQQQLEKSRVRKSASLNLQPGGAAVHNMELQPRGAALYPIRETGNQPTAPSWSQSSNSHMYGIMLPAPCAVDVSVDSIGVEIDTYVCEAVKMEPAEGPEEERSAIPTAEEPDEMTEKHRDLEQIPLEQAHSSGEGKVRDTAEAKKTRR